LFNCVTGLNVVEDNAMTTKFKVGMTEQSKAVVVSAQIESDEMSAEEIAAKTEELYDNMKQKAFRHATRK